MRALLDISKHKSLVTISIILILHRSVTDSLTCSPIRTSLQLSSTRTPFTAIADMLSYKDNTFIAVLVIYVGLLPGSIILWVRNGLFKATTSAYRLHLFFMLFRILTAAFYLATITYPTNTSVWAGYITCLGTAVSILLSCLLGHVTHVIEYTNVQTPSRRFSQVMRAVNIVILIAFILGIVGGVNAMEDWSSTGTYKPSTLSKVSIALFIAGWVFITGLLLHKRQQICNSTSDAVKVWHGLVACMVLLLPRIIYQAINVFHNSRAFSSLYGSTTILICMVLVEEMLIATILEVLGFVAPLRKAQSEVEMIQHEVRPKSSISQ